MSTAAELVGSGLSPLQAWILTNPSTLQTASSAIAQYGLQNVQTSAPTAQSQATFVSIYGENTYSGVGGFTGTGHVIGGLFKTIINAPSQTVALAIASEGAFIHTNGTTTRAVGVLGSLNTLATGKTITTWEGVTSHANSGTPGTITNAYGFNVDWSGFTGVISSNMIQYHIADIPGLSGSSINYGIFADVMTTGVGSAVIGSLQNSGTTRYGNYFTGTVQHILGGKTRIGAGTDPVATLDVTGTVAVSGTLSANGGVITGLTTQTGSTYTVAATDTSIIANFAGTATLTLPDASSCSGRTLRARTITANTVVSATSNVIPLAGGAAGTAILAATAGKWADLQSDGSSWQIMAAA